MIERLSPGNTPTPRGPYSPVVRAGDFLYVSGQVCVDPDTDQMSLGDIQHETRVTIGNLKRLLEGCGASLADVVKCSVFLKDGRDFSAMNEIYTEFFGAAKPARTTVAVAFANPDIKIEIDCIAYKPLAK